MGAQRIERKRRESRGGGVPGWSLALGGLILGLILGLVYAWVISPVVVTNATPGDLAPGGQRAWVQMTADSYAITNDAATAAARLQSEFFEPAQLQVLLSELVVEAQAQGDLAREERLRQLTNVMGTLPVTPPGEPGGEAAVPTPEDAGSPLGTLLMACGFGLLALVLLGGIAVMVTRARQSAAPSPRRSSSSRNRATTGLPSPAAARDRPVDDTGASLLTLAPEDEEADEGGVQVVEADDDEGVDDFDLDRLFAETADVVEEAAPAAPRRVEFAEPDEAEPTYLPPLDEFVTRYNYGDDGYDMSFAIETAQTEFLGETGVGISEVANKGESPQQVTAFEVWLFDKDDIRTVTKVLLSDHAWNNQELRSSLAPKGELVHVQEGDTIDLETKSLRVRARVREADYGRGGRAPNSYFERFVVELTAQRKQ